MTGELPRSADLVVRNAAILGGTGAAPFAGDVAVTAARIVAIGELGRTVSDRELDAAGRTLVPGFIRRPHP